MSDLAIAGMLFSFFVALAIAAPIWGYDSRDGIESDQFNRRVTWLHDRPTIRPAGVVLAGALRVVAHRLDQDAALEAEVDRQLARAV
jgi:hypothetical protein